MVQVVAVALLENLPHNGFIKRAYLLGILCANISISRLATLEISYTTQTQIGVGDVGIPSEITFVVVRLNLIELIVLQFSKRRYLAIRLGCTSIGNGNHAIVERNHTFVTLYSDGCHLLHREELGSINSATMRCFNIGIYHAALALKTYYLDGIELLLLHVARDAHLATAHILGRDGVGAVASNLRIGHLYLNPVGVALVVELLLGRHIIAILKGKAILHEAGGRRNLHFEGLLIACNVTYQVGAIGSTDITIELRSVHSNLVAMHIEHEVYDATTVSDDVISAGRVDAVPVYLITHTVETSGGTCRYGELGHACTDGVTIACGRAIALVPSAVNLHRIVTHYITTCSRCTILVECIVETGIAIPVYIYIAAHPATRVVKGGLHLGTSLG